MTVKIASHAGFCPGVRRASEALDGALAGPHRSIMTLGRLIHNDEYVRDTEARGVSVVSREDLPAIEERVRAARRSPF